MAATSKDPSVMLRNPDAKSNPDSIFVMIFPVFDTNPSNPFIIYPTNRNTKVNTAAITWLSVMEETKSPIAILAAPNKKKPNIAV